METTEAKILAIERTQVGDGEEIVLFCVERPDIAAGWLGFEIPTGAIWPGSMLARLAAAQRTAETSGNGLGVETIEKKGILLRGVAAGAMRDLVAYLVGGSVPLEFASIAALAGLLDYFALLTVRCEYPLRFLRIKLREMWFRKNLYSPAFSNSPIQDPLFDLLEVGRVAEVLTGAIRLRADKQFIEHARNTQNTVICSEFGLSKGFRLEVPAGVVDWSAPSLSAERTKEFGRAPLWKCSRQQASGSLADPHEELLSQYETKETKPSKLPLNQTGLPWSPELGLDSVALWSNVLLAGGAVTHCLLGLSPPAKRHDFDLFLWGMSHEHGLAKITELICALRPSRVYRSRRALTLFDCKDRRKYQIVLRLYQTPAEILHSFDVDACCVGFDGSGVLMTARARHAFDTMTNVVDFDLLSPSYESRLVKYMDRYFAISIPGFDPAYLNCASLLSIGEECSKIRRSICQHMQGLDVILYAVFGGHCAAQSDYVQTGTGGSKNDKQNVMVQYGDGELDAQKVWVYATFGEGYTVSPSQGFSPEIIEDLICGTPAMLKRMDALSARIELMSLGAGEQATSTYHGKALANIKTWYNGCFFSLDGGGDGSEVLAALILGAKKAVAANMKKQAARRHPSTWPYGWNHPANVSERLAALENGPMRTRVGQRADGVALGLTYDNSSEEADDFDRLLAQSLTLEDEAFDDDE
jgi:hypothetical protein